MKHTFFAMYMWERLRPAVFVPRLLGLSRSCLCAPRGSYSTRALWEPVPCVAPQPREFHGCMHMVKSSPMKLNLVAKLIRKLPIGQALAQVEFCEKKVAEHIKIVLRDTQRRAVIHHKVDPLDLWVAESFVGKGQYKKSIRYHGKGMCGLSHKMYAHYFLTLREGKPQKKTRSPEDHSKRKTKKLILAGPRTIPNSL